MKKSKKGFTLIEVLVVIAILGILMMIAMPSFNQTRDLNFKNLTNTTHKIVLNAIDFWIKDNADPSQRPANFNSKNSQGNTVYDYISNDEIFQISNLKKEGGVIVDVGFEENKRQIQITFEKGVLNTKYLKLDSSKNIIDSGVGIVFGVYDLNNEKTGVKNYDSWLEKNYIIEGDYKSVI